MNSGANSRTYQSDLIKDHRTDVEVEQLAAIARFYEQERLQKLSRTSTVNANSPLALLDGSSSTPRVIGSTPRATEFQARVKYT